MLIFWWKNKKNSTRATNQLKYTKKEVFKGKQSNCILKMRNERWTWLPGIIDTNRCLCHWTILIVKYLFISTLNIDNTEEWIILIAIIEIRIGTNDANRLPPSQKIHRKIIERTKTTTMEWTHFKIYKQITKYSSKQYVHLSNKRNVERLLQLFYLNKCTQPWIATLNEHFLGFYVTLHI